MVRPPNGLAFTCGRPFAADRAATACSAACQRVFLRPDSGARKRLLPAVVPSGRRAGSDCGMAAIRTRVVGGVDASIRPVPRPAERIGRRSPGRLGRGPNNRSRSGQDVRSRASARFWELFRQLPAEVQDQARAAYRTFTLNPRHPGLQFKRCIGMLDGLHGRTTNRPSFDPVRGVSAGGWRRTSPRSIRRHAR